MPSPARRASGAAAALFPDKVGGLVIVAGALDPALEEIYYVQFAVDLFPIAPVTVIRLEGTNHFLPWNSEDVIRQAISEMLATPDPAPQHAGMPNYKEPSTDNCEARQRRGTPTALMGINEVPVTVFLCPN